MELAGVVLDDADRIAQRWVERVRASLSPRSFTADELLDSLPVFLRQLVDALRQPPGSSTLLPENRDVARLHGRQRQALGIASADVVDEYGQLQQVILELAEERGVPLRTAHVRRLSEVISAAAAEAVSQYEQALWARRAPSSEPEAARSADALLTALRRTESALRASEDQFRAVFSLAATGMGMSDAHTGRLWEVNERLCELTGYSANELREMTYLDLVHPEDRAEDERRFRALVEGAATTYHNEKRYLRKDGRVVWVSVSARIIPDASGRPPRSVAIIQDITERKEAEAALRESDARMRGLLDSTLEGIYGLDVQGFCTFANPACARLLGYDDPAALVGRHIHELTHHTRPDGTPYPAAECTIYRTFRRGEDSASEDDLFFRADGTPFAVRFRSSPVLRAGQVVGAVVTFEDVTQTRQAEREQAQNLTLLNTLADSAAEALFMLDDAGRASYLNPAAERMFGWSRDELQGKVVHDLIHHHRPDGTEYPISECPLGGVFEHGEPVVGHEDLFFHRSGRPVPVVCSNAPVIQDGKVTGAVLVVHDVSERRKAELDRDHQREFEQQLMGIVSHDLRNPISAILISAGALLRRGDLDERLTRNLVRIIESGERANRLIRDLLDFTQARLGRRIPVEPRPLDLHQLARQVLDEIRQVHPDRTIELREVGEGQGQWDPDRLAQVMTNLVVNALKYSPSGSVVRVETRGRGERAALSVHNEGPPIPPEVLPGLFEPLRRGDGTRQGADRSVGLGLFIVRSLVEAHKGTVTVRSDETTGTTFTVEIPRHAGAD